MPKSLLDLVEATETVAEVPVYGLSIEGVATLLLRFPELRALMGGGDVDANALASKAPAAVGAIVAAGLGHPGEDAHELAARRLSINTQLDFLAAILRLTFPQGVGPFVEKLTALGAALAVPAPSAPEGASATPTTVPATS
jgi:hypothetical protein